MTINEGPDHPNIVLLVWDACRYDYAAEHASFLNELASSNLWFENAVAPSPWSLPSHASIFTGELPHEHKKTRFGDSIHTPLVEELSHREYTSYGVSANGFASQRTGFHEAFDRFRYTGGRDRYIEGLDVSGYSQNLLRDPEMSQRGALWRVLKRIPEEEHSLKSLANLLSVGVGELAMNRAALQRIPHPVFAPTSDYSYEPENNTRVIKSLLSEHDEAEPFFLFANYMDTHRCYKPDPELQEKHLGRTLEYSELLHLNEEVAAPWSFETQKARDELNEDDLKDLRSLYTGEIETLDAHLKRIHGILEAEELLEETVIIVTADHGENLGETDEVGRRRFGHESSVSSTVLHVPLVVAHPELDAERIETPLSLESLYDFCLGFSEIAAPSTSRLRRLADDTTAVSEYPATGGGNETLARYPEAEKKAVEHRSSENSVVTQEDAWRVIVESTGDQWLFHDGTVTGFSEAPETLVSLGINSLEALADDSGEAVSDEQVSRLEALGYL